MCFSQFHAEVPGEDGFTLVELIVVMIVVGILAVAAMPRFFDNVFDERGFHDAAKSAVQHARRVAVASRRYVCVTTTPGAAAAGTVAISMDTNLPESNTTPVNCTVPIALPSPGRGCAATNQVCAPNGVTLGGSSVFFDPLGRSVTSAKAVQAAALSITVTNQTPITIQPETGWVQ
jgi:MSHA pilin protein MshC